VGGVGVGGRARPTRSARSGALRAERRGGRSSPAGRRRPSSSVSKSAPETGACHHFPRPTGWHARERRPSPRPQTVQGLHDCRLRCKRKSTGKSMQWSPRPHLDKPPPARSAPLQAPAAGARPARGRRGAPTGCSGRGGRAATTPRQRSDHACAQCELAMGPLRYMLNSGSHGRMRFRANRGCVRTDEKVAQAQAEACRAGRARDGWRVPESEVGGRRSTARVQSTSGRRPRADTRGGSVESPQSAST
jgi:hypothetical protein